MADLLENPQGTVPANPQEFYKNLTAQAKQELTPWAVNPRDSKIDKVLKSIASGFLTSQAARAEYRNKAEEYFRLSQAMEQMKEEQKRIKEAHALAQEKGTQALQIGELSKKLTELNVRQLAKELEQPQPPVEGTEEWFNTRRRLLKMEREFAEPTEGWSEPFDYNGVKIQRNLKTGELREVPSKKESPEKSPFEQEQKLRKEFSFESGNFKTVKNAYNTIESTYKMKSAAGDVGMIFAIMKMFDPTSVVREGEFATAANSAGVPERVRAQYNRLITGERLSDATREDFRKTAQSVFSIAKADFLRLKEHYSGLATQYGLDPKKVTYGYEEMDEVSDEELLKELGIKK